MRSDRTDPGPKATTPRPEDWQPELSEPARADAGEGAALRGRTAPVAEVSASDPWLDVKSRFVDDPAGAIAAAERLVHQAVDDKIRELQDEAAAVLAPQGEDASSTEALRIRLIRYQTYCQTYCQRLAGTEVH